MTTGFWLAIVVATVVFTLSGRAENPPSDATSKTPEFKNLSDLKWGKILPDLRESSPEICILRILGVEPTSNELAEIGKFIDEKKIRVIVSQTFALSEAAKAQERVATGHTRGKIVLKVAEEPK